MIVTLIFISAIVIFAIRTSFFSIGAYLERRKEYHTGELKNFPFISVIVPARNEEGNIRQCIESIAKNKYPKDRFEVIAVNDRSTDSTGKILNDLHSSFPNLQIVTVTEETAIHNLKGKPGALEAGIRVSKGSIILMTDADCTVRENWIETIAKGYENPNVGLVASFTHIKGNRIFDKIQAVEWICMNTMGSGGIGIKQPLACYGNNMSVKKSDFDKIGGYSNIKFSVTEDLALLQAIHKLGRKIRYITNPEALAVTFPCVDLKEYFNQHHRWAIGGLSLGWKAVFFVISSLAVWIGIITAIVTYQPIWLGAVLISRIICDFILINPSIRILKKQKLYPWIIPSVLFFILIEATLPFLILNKDIKWKGQLFNKH